MTGIPAEVGVKGKPAGFWIRVVAWIIDAIILSVVGGILSFAIEGDPLGSGGASTLLDLVIGIGYYVFMTGNYGATLGKMALNIYILNEQGERRIGYGRAALRYIGSFVSAIILLIGYIMVAFREDKRGLHDLIANTYPTQIIKR